MIFIGAALAATLLLIGCGIRAGVNKDPVPGNENPGNNSPGDKDSNGKTLAAGPSGSGIFGKKVSVGDPYAVKTTLKELSLADPEKGIGVYGRYTELTPEGEVPETLARVLAEVNARAKENVEAKAGLFLADNNYPAKAGGAAVTER